MKNPIRWKKLRTGGAREERQSPNKERRENIEKMLRGRPEEGNYGRRGSLGERGQESGRDQETDATLKEGTGKN